MSGRNTTRIALSLMLALVLALTLAQPGAAAGRSSLVARTQDNGLFERAWGWLTGWWIGQDGRGGQGLTRLWGEEGPGMDPDGKAAHLGTTRSCGATVCTDMGPGMDPDGAVTRSDAGFGMDPNGGH
jgi:hypothetical protein